MSTKEKLLACQGTTHIVTLPNEQKVKIRALTGEESDQFNEMYILAAKVHPETGEKTYLLPAKWRSNLCIKACLNDDGTQMFDEKDVDAIEKIDRPILDYLTDEIQKFSKLDSETEAEAEK